MKKKRIFAPFLAGLTLMVGLSSSALATTGLIDSTVSGGWSEDEGYFTNNNYKISPRGDVVMEHSGWIEKGMSGMERAVCTTWWKETLHYSRARMEAGGGMAITDSGRKWGVENTYAESPYAASSYLAKTYYGKDE
ncbi:hypothetical protein [Paenibacillus etheri]|uniref:Uncharacterized protein n=1 Tax=Paenibacillus etheri TaxID=1306852 RepID=A0A0W1B479_9BACL|nr:hypothetical protein [Paenibacillus etheri]KTD88337.1 hypothetical protein UQ64_05995 [Paenibacillus etheri]